MTHVALTVIAPLRPGRRDAVSAALDALPAGAASPLASIPGLHVGRLTIIGELGRPPGSTRAAPGPFLLFAGDADGPLEAVVTALTASCGPLFEACVGCPDPADGPSFAAWLLRHRVRDRWTIMPYARRTLPEVQAALAVRAALGSFAVEAAALDATALRRRFLDRFARPRPGATEG